MKASLVGFNAVVLAKVFNPSIMRDSWLLDQHILEPDDLRPGFVFTEEAVQAPSRLFTLTVLPQQLQFAPTDPIVARDVVPRLLGQIIRALPHTPFSAAGLNFVWHLHTEAEQFAAATRRLFCKTDLPIASEFRSDDAHFGLYMSKTIGESRLKLDIKPISIRPVDLSIPEEFRIQTAFNFQRSVSGNDAPVQIQDLLNRWTEHEELSARLANQLAEAT